MISIYATQNWVTIIIIFLIAFLVTLHYLYLERFVKFVSFYKTEAYFVDYIDKKGLFYGFFNGFLFFFQLGVYALFLYLIKLQYANIDGEIAVLLNIVNILFVFFIGRFLIGKMFSYIFGIAKIQIVLSFVKFTYLSKVAIYIFPLIIISFYLPTYKRMLLLTTIVLTIVMLLYFYGKIVLQNQKLIFHNLFYFILYLCTLEIIPLVYLYKTIF